MKQVLRPSALAVKEKFKDKPLIIAEVGVREAINMLAMLRNMNIERAYLVDNYDTYHNNEFDNCNVNQQEIYYKNMYSNMEKYLDRVTFITRTSRIGASIFPHNYFDYVYIDANHSRASVYEDITVWYPKVKEGGIIGGHDAEDVKFPGVPEAVEFFCRERDLKYQLKDNDWIIEK